MKVKPVASFYASKVNCFDLREKLDEHTKNEWLFNVQFLVSEADNKNDQLKHNGYMYVLNPQQNLLLSLKSLTRLKSYLKSSFFASHLTLETRNFQCQIIFPFNGSFYSKFLKDKHCRQSSFIVMF